MSDDKPIDATRVTFLKTVGARLLMSAVCTMQAPVMVAAAQPLPSGFGRDSYNFLSPPPASAVAPTNARGPFLQVPRVTGRLTSHSLGLVINTADPYSIEVGEFYVKARALTPAQVLRVALPVRATLTPAEFAAFAGQVNAHFGAGIEALALAWTLPYAVNCNSITGALALGFDADLCDHSCSASKRSPYFDAATFRPNTDLKLRPSMLLAAPNVAAAKAMIRRGVDADGSLRLRSAPPAHAYFVKTDDSVRSVRAPMFPRRACWQAREPTSRFTLNWRRRSSASNACCCTRPA